VLEEAAAGVVVGVPHEQQPGRACAVAGSVHHREYAARDRESHAPEPKMPR